MRSDTTTRSGRESQAHGAVCLHATTWRPETEAIGNVVLIHGYGEHSGRYRHVAERLVDDDLAVHTIDLRGHGRSTGVPRGVIDDFDAILDDVDALVDEVRADGPVVLYGHSMGGLAAILLAERRSADLAGAVIASAALKAADSIPGPLVAVANVLGRLAPDLPTIALDATAVSRDPAVVADYESDPLNFRGKIPAGTGREMNLAMQRALSNAGSISCPLLILHGTNDALTAAAGSIELAAEAGSEDVTLSLWPKCRHELHNEPERDRVLAEIASWIVNHVS